VRYRCCVWLWLVVFGALCSAAQRGDQKSPAGEQFVGTWSGSWDVAGSGGGFELTLEKDKSDTVIGKVSVTGEPTYKAEFKSLSFDGNKMTAKYDFPPDDRVEVALTAVFEGNTAKGTWSAREKGSDSEVATGGWTVTKK
jgi:hypothetical protein